MRGSSRRATSPLEREVMKEMGRTIHHYRQIEEGDCIGVAVSGGVQCQKKKCTRLSILKTIAI